jgi:hypothetical protein
MEVVDVLLFNRSFKVDGKKNQRPYYRAFHHRQPCRTTEPASMVTELILTLGVRQPGPTVCVPLSSLTILVDLTAVASFHIA